MVALLVLFAAPIGLLDQLLGMALAGVVIVAAVRRPDRALLALAVFLPLQKYLVAFVFRLGGPLALVRGLGWLKEALMISILAAGLHAFRTARRQIDAVDRVAILWLAGVTLYFALPTLLSAPGAPEGLDVRLQGYRANAFFVLLFLGARHAPLPNGFARKLAKTLGVVLGIVAAAGVYQFVDPHGWIRFTQDVVQVPRYQNLVQGLTPRQLQQDFGWLYLTPVRVGSVLVNPTEFCDLLLIGLAIAIDRAARGGARLSLIVATGAIGMGLVVSRTRVDLIAAGIIVLLLLRPAPRHVAAARARVGLLIALGVILVAPFQIGTRITGGEGGSASSGAHVDEFVGGLERIEHEPRGFGLGTNPNVGARFGLAQTYISDNSYLQVGNELGVVMMAVFLALVISILVALRRADRAPPHPHHSAPLAGPVFAVGIGLSFVAMLHQVWLSIPVSWLFFAVAGVALSRDDHEPVVPEPVAGWVDDARTRTGR
jgi:hypothetical protein